MKTGNLVIAALVAGLVIPTALKQLAPQIDAGVAALSEREANTQSQEDQPPRKASYNVQPEEDEDRGYALATSKRDKRGHFSFVASMNGADIDVLVDTGATSVAINRSTAEQMGIYVEDDAEKMQVNTANGKAIAYRVTIDEIIIEEVVVNNVEGLVLDDESLSGTLLGMSFLNKLEKFEIDGDTLTLIQ